MDHTEALMDQGVSGALPTEVGRSAAPTGLSPASGSQAEPAAANALIDELVIALCQYRDDLRYPPAPDSIERRLAMVTKLIAKAETR